jgi:Xaa-Pro dipeptidase
MRFERMDYVLHPRSEIDARIRKLQSQIGDLTGVLLFQSVDMGYFSGTAQEGLVYIPRDSQAVVMIKKSFLRASQESPLAVLPLKSLKNLKAELEIPPAAVIGLELDVLPWNNYSRVAKVLEGASFVDISERIKHIRSVKSDFEISLHKEAARIVDAGIASIADHLQEGMMEIELAARIEGLMRSMGHQGTIQFRRFNHVVPMGHLMAGPNASVPSFVASPTGGQGISLFNPQGPGVRKIRRKEPILVDFGGVYNGYTADETRIFAIGRVRPELEEAHLAALDIQDAVARELRPGRKGRDLFVLSESMGEQLGYKDQLGGPPDNKCGFVGHGVGLELDEFPVLGPTDHLIQEKMTVAVEPKMIYPGLGVVGVEDTFLTTKDGGERMTKLPREIWQV